MIQQYDAPVSWQENAKQRYLGGEWRSPIFKDLVVESLTPDSTVLDIGCGHGFDHDAELQQEISGQCARLIGIEPDPEIAIPSCFDECHIATLETAPLQNESIDVAYSSFVLEHVADPIEFWSAVHRSLKPGGVFWGFTVDGRHPFRIASDLLEKLRLKDAYLRYVQGVRGDDRYENYPTFYRCNTPRQVEKEAAVFSSLDFLTLHRPGQLDFYFPRFLRPITRAAEAAWSSTGMPGSVLVIKATK